jgi:DNA-binding PadR family transcriptional regulator
VTRRTGDLSSTFGAAAAVLAPSPRRRRTPADNGARPHEQHTTVDEQDVTTDEQDTTTDHPGADHPGADRQDTPPDDHDTPTDESGTEPMRTESGATRRGRPAGRRSTRPTAKRRPAPPHRRVGRLRIRDPHQLDLLLLAVVERRPGNGHAVHDLLRELSDGAFDPTIQGVLRALRRLTSNRLVTRDTDDRHYELTPLGDRILAAWRREWAAFSSAVDDVVRREHGDAPR